MIELLLYHGTDYNSAIKICNEKKTSHDGLWCANDASLAASYGNVLVCIWIPEGSYEVEAYPLSTGKITDTLDWQSEPMEFRIEESSCIVCDLV